MKCASCNENDCLTCSDSSRNIDRGCECNEGFYAKIGDVSYPSCAFDCNEGCKTCDSSGVCTGNSCKSGYLFDSNTEEICVKCDNIPGYTLDFLTGEC